MQAIFGDRRPLQSLTFWGLVILGAVQTAEQTGVVPPGTVEGIKSVANSIGGLLIVLGLRRSPGSFS